MLSTADDSNTEDTTRRLFAQNTMIFKIHHNLVNIYMPPYFQPATFLARQDHQFKYTIPTSTLQVLILPQKYNSYKLESATYNGSHSHNHISLQGYSPSRHQSAAASSTRLKTSVL